MRTGDVENEEGIRSQLAKSLTKIQQIRGRLDSNERKIALLEGVRRGGDSTWGDTVTTADAVIAAVAAIEIAAGMSPPPPEMNNLAKAALGRTGLSADDIERFAHASQSAQMGSINLLQGHLGEQMTLDLLQSGVVPGPTGRVPHLAAAPNQEGYDISFVDPNHQLPTINAQVKISESATTIREHFARNPDVSIVYANSDAARQIAHDKGVVVVSHGAGIPDHADKVVVDIGVSHDHVRGEAARLLDAGAHHSLAHDFLDNLPWLSLVLVVGRAAHEYVDGDLPEREILRDAGRRARDIMLASGLGHAATAVTSEPVTGSITAVSYLILGNAIRAARKDIARATARFGSSRLMLQSMSPAT